jgi:methionine adenosyltransferase
MKRLFTSESVSEGHPDKIADRISDKILDSYLAFDPKSHVGCETLVTTGQIVLAGEIRSNVEISIPDVARSVVNSVGYTKTEYGFSSQSVGVLNGLHRQSQDIAQGVDKEDQGAGDQGMMFGYATSETPAFLPFPLYMSNLILEVLAEIRKEGCVMTYLRPDSKSQVTVETDENMRTVRIDSVVVSTQHDDFLASKYAGKELDDEERAIIESDIREYVFPRVIDKIPEGKCKELAKGLLGADFTLFVNPTGRFVIGGPHGDAGLTGRKIIVDTYGGYAPHGGGAFSGKDPSKVDRSAAYAARYIAKNLVAAGVAEEVTVQLAYAIGISKPVSIRIQTKGKAVDMSDEEIAEEVVKLCDLSPRGITRMLNLEHPIYEETACYGHFGRTPKYVSKTFENNSGNMKIVDVKLFPWEETDLLEELSIIFSKHYI